MQLSSLNFWFSFLIELMQLRSSLSRCFLIEFFVLRRGKGFVFCSSPMLRLVAQKLIRQMNFKFLDVEVFKLGRVID